MFPGVDEDLKGFLFQGAPQEHCAWMGDIFSLTENTWLSFRSASHQKVAQFSVGVNTLEPHRDTGF